MTSSVSRTSRKPSRRAGAAAIELAVTLPLLIVLFLGACDFGRFGHVHSAVVNAARAGAGQGILNRPTPTTQAAWEAAIRRAVTNELAGIKAFDADLLSVNSSCVKEPDGQQRVSVQVTYQFSTLVAWGLIPSQVALRQTTVLRML